MRVLNIAAYKFVTLPEAKLADWRICVKDKAVSLELKGTILLSVEGVNLFLAGTDENITEFKAYLADMQVFGDLTYKESFSEKQPFRRMLVRIKPEIVAFGLDTVKPEKHTAPYIAPETLKQWYEENREMIILDTRNKFEVRLGTFNNAIDLQLKHFRDFPKALQNLDPALKNKPVVTFCTGGIRCEKAAELMHQIGFQEVYQLEGGVLNYFEKCGGAYYTGECFVFDQRVAVNERLEETDTIQCFDCRSPLRPEEQNPLHEVCPYCKAPGEKQG